MPEKHVSNLLYLVVIAALLGVVMLLFALARMQTQVVAAQGALPSKYNPAAVSRPNTANTICAEIIAVSHDECEALIDHYNVTSGAEWLQNSNWLSNDNGMAPCDWYGIRCSGGHVVEIQLGSNGLSGTLSSSLKQLIHLTTLHLEKNALHGRIPPDFCNLAQNLRTADFGHNGLFTYRKKVERCMRRIDPDWQLTQSVSPLDLRPVEFYTNAIELAWTPISYTTGSGFYEIRVATHISGPYTLHGQTADKLASSYLIDGLEPGRTYYVGIRTHRDAAEFPPHELLSKPVKTIGVTKAEEGNVLIAAYFPADNDLATQIEYVMERFRKGTELNPNIKVILLIDGRQDGDTQIIDITGGEFTYPSIIQDVWGQNELDTSDPDVLAWFLHYARASFPATRKIVALMGHGLALAPEVTWPVGSDEVSASQNRPHSRVMGPATRGGKLPPLPRKWRDTPGDLTNNAYMSTTDVGQALMDATDDGARPFDVVFFDQCFQGSVDALYEVHKTATVFVASPNYAWLAAAYDKYITQITPQSTAEDIAQSIIDLYHNTLDERHPNSIFWIRGADIPPIAEAVSSLGDALSLATQQGEETGIWAAASQASYVDTTQCGRQNLQLAPPDELVGAGTFAFKLQENFAAGDSSGVHEAARELISLLQQIEKQVRTGRPYIAPGEQWSYRDTLTILAPLPRNTPSNVAWRASIYSADAPFTATWSIDPTRAATITTSLAFARDGRWDEFLKSWYINLEPTIGAWCHYIPAQQVIIEEAETLSLTVETVTNGRVMLGWDETGDTQANQYWLYRWGPLDVSWQVEAVVELSETTYVADAVDPGLHRFGLLVGTEDKIFVGQSNSATIRVDDLQPPDKALFLPLINP